MRVMRAMRAKRKFQRNGWEYSGVNSKVLHVIFAAKDALISPLICSNAMFR